MKIITPIPLVGLSEHDMLSIWFEQGLSLFFFSSLFSPWLNAQDFIFGEREKKYIYIYTNREREEEKTMRGSEGGEEKRKGENAR